MRARTGVTDLEQIPNVGPATARDLRRLGVRTPADLTGRDPFALYYALCDVTGTQQDPCVMDVFIAAVRYMEGAPARPWWRYTAGRKRALAVAARSSNRSRSRVLRVSDAARSNSARASSIRPSLNKRSPRTLGNR